MNWQRVVFKENMKAILLAAGKGTRLRPLTEKTPKVLIPINGKPIMEYHVEQLAFAGIKSIFINLHYLPQKIKNHFQSGRKWGIEIEYSYEPEILGTSGAVKNLKKNMGKEPFLVIYGDNFLNIDYKKFIKYSEANGGIGNIAVFEKKDVQGCGIVEIGENQEIFRFIEKPIKKEIFSHWVNAGVYYLRKDIFEHIRPGNSDFGFDVFPQLLLKGKKLYAYKLKGEVLGIDSLELLEKLSSNHKEEQT